MPEAAGLPPLRLDLKLPLALLVVFAALVLLTACSRDEPDAMHQVSDPLTGRFSGDLDEMIEQRRIRALVPYGRTFFFVDEHGTPRGLSHSFMEAFEDHVNEQLDRGLLRVRVEFVPVTRERLIPWLLEGRGDVIAADLTITGSRRSDVLFTRPLVTNVRELLVSGPSADPLESLDQMAGRSVLVRPHTSYYESLVGLNSRLRPNMRFQSAPSHFEVEDMLEMVNAGLADHAVADEYLADFWEQIFDEIEVHRDLPLREGAEVAFAVRPESVELKALLDDFLETHRAGTLFGNVTFQRFLQDTRWVDSPADREERSRFRRYADTFRHFGEKYDLDWLMLMALAYQESGLDHSARSPAGAVGLMQLLPATGAQMGVGDIAEMENNVHAGARYIRWMIDRYYADEPMDESERLLFALASYNAGPRRVRQLRNEAEELGLDPDLWFDNVEVIAASRIGRETVSYVSNIYKYYVAYRLIAERDRMISEELVVPDYSP